MDPNYKWLFVIQLQLVDMAATVAGGWLRNELQRFIVPHIEKTGISLGTGAYGEVLEMKMNGEKVAVKKLHSAFVGAKNWADALKKFEEECVRYCCDWESN